MAHIRKLNLIIAQSDIVNVLSELIELECVEPTEPEVTLDPPELTDMLKREVMELDHYEANFDKITLLASQYTYYLTGYISSESEPHLVSMLSRFMCAWEITDLSAIDADNAPTIIKHPQLLGKIRSGGRRVFSPLAKVGY